MKPIFIPIENGYLREKSSWGWICEWIEDIDFLFEHEDKINWELLSSNKYATNYLWKNQDKVCWKNLANNKDPKAMSLLKENLGKLITCSRCDFFDLFSNETKAAAELSKEVLDHFKPNGKFAFISNSHCWECKKVPSANKCKVCLVAKWECLSKNSYMVPLIEDFIRSEECKDLYGDIEEYESSDFKNFKYDKQIEFMISLSGNSSLTPFLVKKITHYYRYVVDRIYEETDLIRLIIAFCNSKNNELFQLFCSHFEKTLNKSLISTIVHNLYICWEDISSLWGKDIEEKLINICEKKTYLFITDLNSCNGDTDLSESDEISFWHAIANMKHSKAIKLIENNIEYVNKLTSFDEENEIWRALCENPYAISLINTFPHHVDYCYLLGNPNKEIVDFLMENFEKIDWEDLGDLTDIIYLNHPEPPCNIGIARWIFPEQNQTFDTRNERFSERSVHKDLYQYEGVIVRRNLQTLYNRGVRHEKMERFLFETNSINFIRNNIDYFGIDSIYEWNDCMIRAVFYRLDYENMTKNNADFSEELASYVFNPDRIFRLSKIYNVSFVDIINSWSSD